MAKNRGETDYTNGLYGGAIPAIGATRKFLKLAESCCADWGGMKCLGCPLAEWAGEITPFCGGEDCDSGCRHRSSCACGNPQLRHELWQKVQAKLKVELKALCDR